jgi:hypothetical protein
MEPNTLANGSMIYSKEKVLKHGSMEVSIKVNTKRVRNMAMVNTSGVMELNTKESGKTIKSMEK